MVLYIPVELVDMFLDHYPEVNKMINGRKKKVKVIKPLNLKSGKYISIFTLNYDKWNGPNGNYKTTIDEDNKQIFTPYVSGDNYYNEEFLEIMTNEDLVMFIGTGNTSIYDPLKKKHIPFYR